MSEFQSVQINQTAVLYPAHVTSTHHLYSQAKVSSRLPADNQNQCRSANMIQDLLPGSQQVLVQALTRLDSHVQSFGSIEQVNDSTQKVVNKAPLVTKELLADHSLIRDLTASRRAFSASRWRSSRRQRPRNLMKDKTPIG